MNKPRRLSLDEAARVAVEALGGLQVVGAELWPHMNPILAGQRLSHALTASREGDKLKGGQYDWIFDQVAAIGEDDAIECWGRGRGTGYVVTRAPLEVTFAQAVQRAAIAKMEAQEAAADLQILAENPRLLAIAQAINPKIAEGLA